MILPPAHLVGLGGAIGAVCRHLLGEAIDVETFPLGTVAVNVLGSFALAALTFGGAGNDLLLLIGTGACGAFTTFSSFSFETVRLVEEGEPRLGVLYAGGTLAGAFAAIGLAWVLVGGS